ncbi:MAG: NAD(P)H-dependent oxidoreductase subunit E [Limnochordia bacterium]|jgi:NADH-quinone oxidoreductase subunit E
MDEAVREDLWPEIGEEVLQRVAEIAGRWKGRPDMLIPVLHEVQEVAGNGIPKVVAQTVADAMGIPLARIYSVQTFYSFFSKEPRGRILIRLCRTAPCHIKGTKRILEAFERALGIKDGETTEDGLFTLETCECIGACDVSPAALVDDTVYGHLTEEKVAALVQELREREALNGGA